MSERTCGDSGGVTKDGVLCPTSRNLSATNGLCAFHDPERRDAFHRAGGRAGGAATAAKHRLAQLEREAIAGIKPEQLGKLETVQDALRWTKAVGVALADRAITPSEANALLRVVKEWRSNEDLRLRREDLRALEEQVTELRQVTRGSR